MYMYFPSTCNMRQCHSHAETHTHNTPTITPSPVHSLSLSLSLSSLPPLIPQDAELLEVFTVQLVNASSGASLGPVATSTITVEANDHPYGRFVFAPTYRPLLGNTEGSEVEIVVTREFGTLGEVTVDFVTIASNNLLTDPALTGVIDIQQLIDAR